MLTRKNDMLFAGDEVMIYSGKYTGFYGIYLENIKDSKTGQKMVLVSVDLSPERIIRKLRIKASNISGKICHF